MLRVMVCSAGPGALPFGPFTTLGSAFPAVAPVMVTRSSSLGSSMEAGDRAWGDGLESTGARVSLSLRCTVACLPATASSSLTGSRLRSPDWHLSVLASGGSTSSDRGERGRGRLPPSPRRRAPRPLLGPPWAAGLPGSLRPPSCRLASCRTDGALPAVLVSVLEVLEVTVVIVVPVVPLEVSVAPAEVPVVPVAPAEVPVATTVAVEVRPRMGSGAVNASRTMTLPAATWRWKRTARRACSRCSCQRGSVGTDLSARVHRSRCC